MGIYDGPVYGQPLPPQARPTYTDQERRAARNQGLLALAAAIGSDAPLGQALAGGVSGGLSAESGYLARIMAERERAAAMARQRMLEDFQAKVAERELAARESDWAYQGERRPLELDSLRAGAEASRLNAESSRFGLDRSRTEAAREDAGYATFPVEDRTELARRQAEANLRATERSGQQLGPRPKTPAEIAEDEANARYLAARTEALDREISSVDWARPERDENGQVDVNSAGPNWSRAYQAGLDRGLGPEAAREFAEVSRAAATSSNSSASASDPFTATKGRVWSAFVGSLSEDAAEDVAYINENVPEAKAALESAVLTGDSRKVQAILDKYGKPGVIGRAVNFFGSWYED